MELWQMDVVGGVVLADGRDCKILTRIDDQVVIDWVGNREDCLQALEEGNRHKGIDTGGPPCHPRSKRTSCWRVW
jgi:hypothetical protein